jgi:hypothetical protein
MTNNRLRLVVWCFGMSVVTMVCTWALVGPPDVQTNTRWRSTSHEIAVRR